MYYGRASETVEWFAKLGYTLPYRINAADFILDLASADVSTEKRCTDGPCPCTSITNPNPVDPLTTVQTGKPST